MSGKWGGGDRGWWGTQCKAYLDEWPLSPLGKGNGQLGSASMASLMPEMALLGTLRIGIKEIPVILCPPTL